MSKLPSISGKNAIAAFEKAGFVVKRIASSHHIMKKDGHRFVLTVPVHGNKDVNRRTLRGLIKAAGLTTKQFRELL